MDVFTLSLELKVKCPRQANGNLDKKIKNEVAPGIYRVILDAIKDVGANDNIQINSPKEMNNGRTKYDYVEKPVNRMRYVG